MRVHVKMMKDDEFDDSVIVGVGETFNICFDDAGRLKERINKARMLLPKSTRERELIISMRGETKLLSRFKSTGL